MNTYKDKPIPFGAKVRRVFTKQFYLPPEALAELIDLCSTTELTMRQVVDYIDEHGGWID